MPTNVLSDAVCRRAAPADKPQKLFDGGGLHLFVSPKGGKTWRVAYRLAGRPQTLSLGPYPQVSLAQARAKRDELKGKLREGEDPMAPRRQQRGGMSFEKACEDYWTGRQDVSPSYRDDAMRSLRVNVWPALGRLPIGSITKDLLLDALRPMDAAGRHAYVRKTRGWCSLVFEWAVEHGEAKINPAALIRPDKAFGKSKVVHFAALELQDMPDFMQRLALEKDINSVLACKLMALTWTRTNELRMMEWGEIEGDLWRLPEGKMKRNRDHLVPLSKQALAIIKVLKARRCGSKYVLPSDFRTDRPLSENTVLHLLYRMGYKGQMTGHGWRSVGSTWANERGYNPDAIERQLAHVPDDEVRSAYNRAAYLPERRTMLQAWADWLDEINRVPGLT